MLAPKLRSPHPETQVSFTLERAFMKRFHQILAIGTLSLFSAVASAFPIAVTGTEGLAVIVSGTDDIIATYQGNSAGYSNDLYLSLTASTLPPGTFIFNNHLSAVGSQVNLGSFAVGTELIFRLYVNNTGESFYTGDATRNADGLAHARVQSNWMPNESLVSFEDLYGAPEGINGYNDLSFSFTNTTSSPAVPEPTSLALLGLGAIGLGFLKRRKK
jgi:PEP-CTERM motif